MNFPEETLQSFTESLSSSSAVPGGGGAAALMGALGIALGNMVGALTIGKQKYADVEEDIRALNEEAGELRERFLSLISADATAFMPLAAAYRIPKEDPDRERIMEEALKVACTVPMKTLHACKDALALLKGYADKGSKLALSDAGCGAVCCKAAMEAALLNVKINTSAMKDRERALALDEESEALVKDGCALADAIYTQVKAAL